MQNQWSFRTKSRLKAIDNSVKVSQVIGKKDVNGNPFYPSFTDETVVLVTEDKRTYENTKASADGQGNMTFTLRGLADDGSETEVAKFKKAWMPGTLCYLTIASQTIESKAEKSDISDAEITIQKNGTDIDSFTLNQTTDKIIDITIPTTASDVGALPDTTKYGASLSLTIDASTFVMTGQLKDQDGNNLGSAQTIDLPLESVVVNGSYDDVNKKIVLTLQNGNTVEFSVADLVSGLQTEITSSNKLDADLIDDSTSTNKFVTATDLTKLSNTSGVNTGDQSASDFDIKDLADSLGLRLTKAATAPNNPSQGDLWYDTTNNKLKTYDGSQWNESGGGGGGGSYSAGTGINIDGNNVISNTSNIQVFYLASTSDLTNAQAAHDWQNGGSTALIIYNNKPYTYLSGNAAAMNFKCLYPYEKSSNQTGKTELVQDALIFSLSSGTVTSISANSRYNTISAYLNTDQNYTTPYTPQYDGSPATKKYVDDAVSGASGIQTLPGSPVTQNYVWIGSEQEYQALGTYRADTEYKIY